MDLDYLLTTLDYLGGTEIKQEALKGIEKLKIIHGEFDRIAPIQEAIDIKNDLTQAEFIAIDKAGHIPFFEDTFNLRI